MVNEIEVKLKSNPYNIPLKEECGIKRSWYWTAIIRKIQTVYYSKKTTKNNIEQMCLTSSDVTGDNNKCNNHIIITNS